MEKKESKSFQGKIHQLIPGGAHTYSKGDDQFPENAPAAIAYGKGAWVWDLDGNKFLDCAMGLTSVSLGHAYDPIVEAVVDEIQKGANFQRPSYIELEMAETFLSLVPQHQMIKFAKNGSTVTTAAVKLARVFTGRKLVAFPGDHPFYSYDDWFIGKTSCNKGVPEEVNELSLTFKSCDLDSLKRLFEKYPNQIAAVIMEPEKPYCGLSCNCTLPVKNYLQKAIALTKENGAVFILDEMVTGFKTDLPGSIKKYDLDPDLATWGKGIANGFSFCALTGKKEIMNLGGIKQIGREKVFLISTTHGAETHSLRAGIKTIEIFKKDNVIGYFRKISTALKTDCEKLIDEIGLEGIIEIQGSNWIHYFIFKNNDKEIDNYYRTYFMQEMFNRGVLFQGTFVPCFTHREEELNFFITAFESVLKLYKLALNGNISDLLIGEPTKPVFRKFN